MTLRLSHLEGMQVVSEAGEHLGRVWEIRSPGRQFHEPRRERRPVESLVCGRLGLLERLGWREPAAFAIPWDAVLEHEDGKLLIRGKADDYERIGPARRKRRALRIGRARRKRR